MNGDRVPYVTTITLMQQRSLAKLNDKVCSNASFSQPLIMGTLGTDATVHKTEESKSTVPRVVEKYEYSLDGFRRFHLGVARGTQRQFSENI